MDESTFQRKNFEEVIDAIGIEWILCFVAEDQSAKLVSLMNNLGAGVSADGSGKKIESGYSYWGIGPTRAWAIACADTLYVVMNRSTKCFNEGWLGICDAISDESYHYVSLGVGTGEKDFQILRELHRRQPDMSYFPIDMSQEMLRVGTRRANVNGRLKRHNVWPIQLDFELESNVKALRDILDKRVGDEPILFSLLGNTLANFEDDEELLKTLAPLINSNDRLLLEVARTEHLNDNACRTAEMEYSKASSFREFVTSALLQNTDLGINLGDVHYESAVERDKAILIKVLHRSKSDTTITLPDRSSVQYPKGDTIRLYLSRKYTKQGIANVLNNCGFSVVKDHPSIFPDSRLRFGIDLLLLKSSSQGAVPASRPSVFISYSRADEEFAKRLRSDLQDAGVRCWLDSVDMRTGDSVRSTLYENIKAHDKLLVILSESSLRSRWVKDEVDTAFTLEMELGADHILFPIRLDDTVMEAQGEWVMRIRGRNIADFRKWESEIDYRRAFDKLLRDLRAGV